MKMILRHLKTSFKGKCESKLVYLARKQMWGAMIRMLEQNGSNALEDKGTASVHVRYETYSDGNILHIMCENHPPASVVKRVINLFPLLTIQLNKENQTPLHVAAACGASHRTISVLLQHGGAFAALKQDINGQTPLHLHIQKCTSQKQICDPGYKRKSDHEKMNEETLTYGPDLKVLRVLAEAAPRSIEIKNKDGKVPSDLRQPSSSSNSDADLRDPSFATRLLPRSSSSRGRAMASRLSSPGNSEIGQRMESIAEDINETETDSKKGSMALTVSSNWSVDS